MGQDILQQISRTGLLWIRRSMIRRNLEQEKPGEGEARRRRNQENKKQGERETRRRKNYKREKPGEDKYRRRRNLE